jgi:hypothetical protein
VTPKNYPSDSDTARIPERLPSRNLDHYTESATRKGTSRWRGLHHESGKGHRAPPPRRKPSEPLSPKRRPMRHGVGPASPGHGCLRKYRVIELPLTGYLAVLKNIIGLLAALAGGKFLSAGSSKRHVQMGGFVHIFLVALRGYFFSRV